MKVLWYYYDQILCYGDYLKNGFLWYTIIYGIHIVVIVLVYKQ